VPVRNHATRNRRLESFTYDAHCCIYLRRLYRREGRLSACGSRYITFPDTTAGLHVTVRPHDQLSYPIWSVFIQYHTITIFNCSKEETRPTSAISLFGQCQCMRLEKKSFPYSLTQIETSLRLTITSRVDIVMKPSSKWLDFC
jgi:hypothetical protein